MNDLMRKLKEIVNLKDIIETDYPRYKSNSIKVYNFSEYSLPIVSLKDIHEGHLSLKHVDDEQSSFPAKIKNLDKGKKNFEKVFF